MVLHLVLWCYILELVIRNQNMLIVTFQLRLIYYISLLTHVNQRQIMSLKMCTWSPNQIQWLLKAGPTKNHESESCSVMFNSLQIHGLYSPWNSPGQNTGVGSLSLLQGILPTQGSNPGLLHCRQIIYQVSHKGSTRMLEWVAYPFSKGSSQPRNETKVSCIADRFFTTELSGKPN